MKITKLIVKIILIKILPTGIMIIKIIEGVKWSNRERLKNNGSYKKVTTPP